MTQSNAGTAKINPRSSGFINNEVYRKHTSERSLADEAGELQRCMQLGVATENVSPIRLVDFDSATNTLTTERVHGDELFHTLWNATYLLGRLRGHRLNDPQTIFSRVGELGQWLALYHRTSASHNADNSKAAWLLHATERKIRDIRQAKLRPERLLNKIETRCLPGLEKLNTQTFLTDNGAFVCRVHGDFIVYNVLIDQNRQLHVVDFGDTRVSGNYEDVARMYSSLYAIADTNRTRRRRLGHLPSVFLNGYGLSMQATETPYFKCNMAYNYLTHLEGQHYMRDLLSWNSNIEMSQITRAGMRWIKRQL